MGGDILRTIVGVGTLGLSEPMFYQQQDAQKKATEAQNAQLEAARQQDLEARRIAASAKPMEEQATLLTAGSKGSVLGNLGLMVEPTKKSTTSLGGISSTGLGFGS